MTGSEGGVEQALRALEDIDPRQLETAAAHLPPELGSLLRELTATLRRGESPREVEDRLREQVGDPIGFIRRLLPLLAASGGAMDRLRAQLTALERAVEGLGQARERIVEGLEALLSQGREDPALAPALERAVAVARELPGPDRVETLLHDHRSLLEEVQQVLEEASPVPPEGLERRVRALEDRSRRLLQEREPILERLVETLDLAVEAAGDRKAALAASLAVHAARIVDDLEHGEPRDRHRRWRRALDLALEGEAVSLAWTAGKHVQAEALRAEDHKLAALVAHRVADACEGSGEGSRALLARMEEAQALARLPRYRERALRLGRHVAAQAQSAEPPVRARLLLMFGQLLAGTKNAAEARKVFKQVVRSVPRHSHPERHPSAEVLGRAALHLGVLEREAGQLRQSERSLRFAHHLGAARGDAGLYEAAVRNLVDLLLQQETEAEIAPLVNEARRRYAAHGMEQTFVKAAEERWGRERVQRWLAGE